MRWILTSFLVLLPLTALVAFLATGWVGGIDPRETCHERLSETRPDLVGSGGGKTRHFPPGLRCEARECRPSPAPGCQEQTSEVVFPPTALDWALLGLSSALLAALLSAPLALIRERRAASAA